VFKANGNRKHNKVRCSAKGNASQGAYEFVFTKNCASQGADERGKNVEEGSAMWGGGGKPGVCII
jgi:hypothetical protein